MGHATAWPCGTITVVSASVSLIIPTWNGAPWIDDCLATALEHAPADTEIIVVDDVSTDDTVERVSRFVADGRVRLIVAPENRGFARTVNRGLAAAHGDVLVMLNQDTRSTQDWLTPLLSVMAADPRIGIVGCRLLYPDGRVQHAGGRIDARGAGSHDLVDPPLDGLGVADVDFVTGAALAIRRDCLNEIGTLDESFGRGYYEDVDLCFRARRAGYRVVYCPAAELIHAEASLSASANIEGMARFQSNRLRFVIKHFDPATIQAGFHTGERAWLNGLGAESSAFVAAHHRSYVRSLLDLDDLVRSRMSNGEDDPRPTVQRVLIDLRGLVPLGATAELHRT